MLKCTFASLMQRVLCRFPWIFPSSYQPVKQFVDYMSGFVDATTGLMTVASYPSTRYGDWCAPNGSAVSSGIFDPFVKNFFGVFWRGGSGAKKEN
jgi:hypothetical protein